MRKTARNIKELRKLAKSFGVPRCSRMRKAELAEAVAAHETYNSEDNGAKSYTAAVGAMRSRLASFRREQIGDCTLYLGDCREILPLLPRHDAVVTDPPYGIGEAAGANKSRGKSKGGGALAAARDYGSDAWDDKPVDPATMAAVYAAADWQIIFGGNYYPAAPSSCWLVWDKVNGNTDFADCELAWTNLPKAVRRIKFMWNGMLRQNKEPRGDHPTQKPVEVMRWCLGHLPAGTARINDPFMGSGTTGVACVSMGLSFTGIEREAKYFDAACRRIEKATLQPDMFPAHIAAAQPQRRIRVNVNGHKADTPEQLDLVELSAR